MIKVEKQVWILFLLLLFGTSTMAQQRINGLDYILQKRPRITERDSTFIPYNFFSIGIGGETILESGYKSGPLWGVNGDVAFGRWFNSVSGGRLTLGGALFPRIPSINGVGKHQMLRLGLNADYLLNLSTLGWGYMPDRKFNLSLLGGGGAHIGYMDSRFKPAFSMQAGLHATLRMCSFAAWYVEPRLVFMTDNLLSNENWKGYNLTPSFTTGVEYTMMPLKNRTSVQLWPKGDFFDNTYVFVGGGAEMLVNRDIMNGLWSDLGYQVHLGFGKQFTPVSGMRLLVTGGTTPWRNEKLTKTRVGVDYTLDLNALASGYHGVRPFGLNLNIGGQLSIPESHKGLNPAIGLGIGVQGIARVSDRIGLYIEPRINIFDKQFADGYSSDKVDVLAELSAGIIYYRRNRIDRTARYDKAIEQLESERLAYRVLNKHWFVSAYGGIQTIFAEQVSAKHKLQPTVMGSIGYWFNPYSGVRVNGRIGLLAENDRTNRYRRTKTLSAGVDYMLNVTNALSGYLPNRRFEIVGTVGGDLIYNTQLESGQDRLNFGITTGLEGIWNVTSQVALSTGPRFGWYADDVANSSTAYLGGDLLSSWMVGVSYRFKPYDATTNRSRYKEGIRNKYFISAGIGTGTMINGTPDDWRFGVTYTTSVGRWYSPLSGWRLGVSGSFLQEIDYHPSSRYNGYLGLDLDYLLDIVTLADGYRQDRLFGVNGVAGISVGVTRSKQSFNFVSGFHAGVQGTLRLSDAFSLYLEPRLAVFNKNYERYGGRYFDVNGTAQLGLIYKFQELNILPKRDSDDQSMFASIGIGTGIYLNSFLGKSFCNKLTLNYELSIGKWFTPTSGVRTGLFMTQINRNDYGRDHFDFNLLGIHADYLLNINSLFDAEQDKLTFLGIVGIGIDRGSFKGHKSWAPSVIGGGQMQYHLSDHIGLFGEVRGVIYGRNLTKDKPSVGIHSVLQGTIGTIWRF